VVLPFYQKAVSFCDFMGLFLPKSIKKRGGCISCRSDSVCL
jgi:hypothetical protein